MLPEILFSLFLLYIQPPLLFARAQVVVEGGWRNKIALPTMRSLGIPVMNTWNSSVTLWSYHYNYKVGTLPQRTQEVTT